MCHEHGKYFACFKPHECNYSSFQLIYKNVYMRLKLKIKTVWYVNAVNAYQIQLQQSIFY